MKPTKNRFFCPDCREFKMSFETEKKAYNFIEYESRNILEENGYCPIRAYFCPICGYWHLTSKSLAEEDSYECHVDRQEMENSRKLLGLVVRNTNTIALNLTRKVNSFSILLKEKVVDWEAVSRLATEVIDIFETIWITPYRYLYNVRNQLYEFDELCHLYIWRKNQSLTA